MHRLATDIRLMALASLLALAALAAACGDGDDTPGATPTDGQDAVTFTLESDAFAEGETIPVRHTCDGENLSPALAWNDVPAGATVFALTMDDPDAPGGTFTHWVLYNLPADAASLAEAVPTTELLDSGALQGRNDAGGVGYTGPCPPPGDPHRYNFRLLALDSALDLGPGASKQELLDAAEGHVLGEGTLTGMHGR